MERVRELAIFLVAGVLAVTLFGISKDQATAQSSCDVECLNDKIAALSRRVMALERSVGGVRATTRTQSKETYFSFSGGRATGGDWTTVSGTTFYFDQSLYGNVVSVSWQGWMDNGVGFARLYDVTNSRAVDGSEVSVSASARASFYSQPLAVWRGQNQYVVQVKNLNLQEVTISTPRLKIVTK